MARMQTLLKAFSVVCLCMVLSGCFGPTPYQVKAFNGGYDDKPVSGERHFVAFYGNGFTSRDAVLKYWLYRCAEVTASAGFDYFVLLAKDSRPGSEGAVSGDASVIEVEYLGTGEAIRAKGGGAPVYIFVPGGGGAVTRWSASGVIEMYKGAPLAEDAATFVARNLLDKLGPEVRAGVVTGQGYKLPEPGGKNGPADREAPTAGSSQPVRLEDLKDLLPK